MDDLIFKFIKKSRRKPLPGDYFYFELLDGAIYIGRVIRNNACMLTIHDMNVIYTYNVSLTSIENIPKLTPSQLLIPPIIANNQGWLKGYFCFLNNSVLEEEDILPIHCFESPINYFCYNEFGERLPERIEPCGVWGIASHATIELEVKTALGID